MKTPRQGPTPVGQRLRAQTIPAKRDPGPSADEWDDDLTVQEWLAEQLQPWKDGCPRCDWHQWWMTDGRCAVCGMDPREQGPAPRRILRGLGDLLD